MELEPKRELVEGVKHDAGKPRMELLSTIALREMSVVLTKGAQKYADHNWRKGMAWSRLGGAALRHVFAWLGGEDKDPEFGCHHLAHAAVCCMFLIEYAVTKTGTDDRWGGGQQ